MSSLRRNLYKAARVLGDVEAAEKGPGSYARRAGRKAVYRRSGKVTRRLLRMFGL